MKRTITVLAAAATLTAAVAPSVSAMEQELNTITGKLYQGLSSMTLPVDSISTLTLSQINRINLVLNSGDTESDKRRLVAAILAE